MNGIVRNINCLNKHGAYLWKGHPVKLFGVPTKFPWAAWYKMLQGQGLCKNSCSSTRLICTLVWASIVVKHKIVDLHWYDLCCICMTAWEIYSITAWEGLAACDCYLGGGISATCFPAVWSTATQFSYTTVRVWVKSCCFCYKRSVSRSLSWARESCIKCLPYMQGKVTDLHIKYLHFCLILFRYMQIEWMNETL
jgi:hypothetical protein